MSGERGPRGPIGARIEAQHDAADPSRVVEGLGSGMPQAEVERRMAHSEEREGLLNVDPVIWLRGAIALDTQRHPSGITNQELAHRYSAGGRFEWDPHIAKNVKRYLRSLGFFVTLLLR